MPCCAVLCCDVTADGKNLAQPPTPKLPPSHSPGLNVVGQTSTDADPTFWSVDVVPVASAFVNIKLVWASGEARL